MLQKYHNQREVLTACFRQVLRKMIFTNRSTRVGDQVDEIAEAEAEVLLKFLCDGSKALAEARGSELCEMGISIDSVLGMEQAARHIGISLNLDLHHINDYYSGIVRGFVQSIQVVIVKEQEQAHSAFEAKLSDMQQQARAANRAKSTFLAAMSHDLITPLSAILGYSQEINHDANLIPRQHTGLAAIHRAGQYLLTLIRNLLDVAGLEAGGPVLDERTFDLHSLLDGMIEMFELSAKKKGLTLLRQCAPDLPRYVHADDGKLRQVVANLLSNAVKFTTTGSVLLRVDLVRPAPAQGIGLVFQVQDSGPGIEAQDLQRIFEPFVRGVQGQQAGEGAGLGLAIGRQFAEAMGGSLSVVSEPERGSLFTFQVTVKPAEPAAEKKMAARPRPLRLAEGQSNVRVLVAEDDEAGRGLWVQRLTAMGFQVREAADGAEAYEMWRLWKPNLVLVSLRLPTLDGYELIRRIKITTAGVKTVLVALTADVSADHRPAVLAAGADDLIYKPVEMDDALAKLAGRLSVNLLYQQFDNSPLAPDVPDLDKDEPETPPGTILMIDDQPGMLDMLVRALKKRGHIVMIVETGQRGLDLAVQMQPDLVLLDMKLPDMDGYRVMAELEANVLTAGIPIVIISAVDKPAQRISGLRYGGQDYITKPFNVDEVIERVHIQLRRVKAFKQLSEKNQHRGEKMELARNLLTDSSQPTLKIEGNITFGMWVKIQLLLRGIPQTALAQEADVTPSMVSSWLSGQYEPPLHFYQAVARQLGLSLEYVMMVQTWTQACSQPVIELGKKDS